jgi:cysteine synthase A
MNIKQNLLELIGNTPLVRINRFSPSATILAKLEYFNPGGSVKDRPALNMILSAEKEGKIKPGDTLVEATSGNTGIGLAWIAAVKGYRLILVMPENMSEERQKIFSAFGAELILTDRQKGMAGAVAEANTCAKTNGYFLTQQFANPANPQSHRTSTAEEIWQDTDGKIDVLVAGIGTGGTITGTGEILKKKNPQIKIIGVEPESSAVLSGSAPSPHRIQGIGAGFVPEILNSQIIDQLITVTDQNAAQTTRDLARLEGLFVGISSGAAMYAAMQVAEKEKHKLIVVIFPDTGERYLSTDLF